MTMRIDGIGTAVPEHSITQPQAVDLQRSFGVVDDKRARVLRALYRRSGIETRRSVLLRASEGPLEERLSFYPHARDEQDCGPSTSARMGVYETEAPGLAVAAAGRALLASDTRPEEITHLITVSCTGFVSPGVDTALVDQLGLSRTVERTNVGFMGCHGALNGLRAARSFVEADPDAVPLLCAVELCTLHFAYGWDPDMLVANALFGDGAAALVGRSTDTDDPWRVAATGTFLMADSEDAMSWRVGDHGFRMTLSAQVPILIEANLKSWLAQWLGEHGLAIAGIASWAVHPGGPRILTSVQTALGLSRDHTSVSRAVLAENGNMSSPTIIFIIDRMRTEGADLPCVALAFGPGLAVEATLFL